MNPFNKQIEGNSPKATYNTIIKTAQHLFMGLGYRAVSTRHIAQNCGITQPALYHHFKNKQTLYISVIEKTLHDTETDMNKILAKFTSFQERLTQIVDYMLVHFEIDLSQMFHDINHELSPDDQKQLHQFWVKGFLMPVVTMIDAAVTQKEIKDPKLLNTNSTELAYLLLSIIKSVLHPPAFSKLTESERVNFGKEKAKLIVEIFFNGVST